MAKKLLLNRIQRGDGIEIQAGRIFDDQIDDVASAILSGAQFLSLPNPAVEAVLEIVQDQTARGRQGVEVLALFAAVATFALNGGGGGVPATRLLTAGDGLIGGGDLSADRTFNVAANADGSIIANANDVQVGILATDAQHGLRGGGTQHANVVSAGASGFMTGMDKAILDALFVGAVPSSRTLTAGTGLTGGGDLSADRTFNVVANADGSIVANANDVQVGVLATDAQHGVRGGGTQHANAVPAGAAGFMTGADKTKLDGLVSGGAAFALGSVIFMGAAGALAQDNANFFFDDTNNRVGIGTNAFTNTREKIRMAKPAGEAYARFDGAVAAGVTDSSVNANLNSSSLFLCFVVGSQTDMDQFGFGNAGLYCCARTGPTPGSPPTLAPFTGLSLSDNGTLVPLGDPGGGRSIYLGGGGWGAPAANDISFHTAPTYTETVDTDVLRMHIPNTGAVAIGLAGASGTGKFEVTGAAIGGVAIRCTVAAPSRVANSLIVGVDADPTAGVFLEQQGAGGVRFARTAATTGVAIGFRFVGAAHTTQTASTEVVDIDLQTSGILQHATGALTTQRTARIQARTYSFVAASTITNAATLAIEAAPIAGTNATLTNSFALWVQAGEARFDGAVRATRTLVTTGIPITLQVTPGADTGLTASTEATDIDFNLARTAQHATGALATQRAMRVRNPTYSFVAASTLTDAATVAIDGAPVAGTNATLTNTYAFWVQAGRTRLQGSVVEDSVISPASLGAGPTADYNPTNLSTARVIRQDTSAAAVVSGLVAQQAGFTVVIMNISANTLTLNNQDVASAAANRFALPSGANLVIPAGGACEVWYDGTSSRWRSISSV